MLEPGRLYITDRGYFDFSLMADILAAKSSFVARVRNNIVYDTLEERLIGDEARRQGIEADLTVRPGCRANAIDRPLRLVRLHIEDSPRRTSRVDPKTKQFRTRSGEHTITLLTDQLDIDASHVALYYRHRWQIELFFRWFKKVLHADRLLSLDEGGLTIILYCALIASMLIALWTGRKPTKRTFEMLCFYFSGWADDEDLERHIERLAKND
jgi:DDE family transposase